MHCLTLSSIVCVLAGAIWADQGLPTGHGVLQLGQELPPREGGWDIAAKRETRAFTQLHLAAGSGDTEAVIRLLDAGVGGNVQDTYAMTPLHYAAWYGQTETVAVLIDRGAIADASDDFGEAPLHWAAWAAQDDVVAQLVERGSNANVWEINGRTPLHWAALADNASTTAILLEQGADVNAPDGRGRTPLFYATTIVEPLRRELEGVRKPQALPDTESAAVLRQAGGTMSADFDTYRKALDKARWRAMGIDVDAELEKQRALGPGGGPALGGLDAEEARKRRPHLPEAPRYDPVTGRIAFKDTQQTSQMIWGTGTRNPRPQASVSEGVSVQRVFAQEATGPGVVRTREGNVELYVWPHRKGAKPGERLADCGSQHWAMFRGGRLILTSWATSGPVSPRAVDRRQSGIQDYVRPDQQ